jgi:transcriptional regulator GlxA family with amidase domain
MMAHPEADLSVPALADRMAMSARNFSRLFHNEIGETPAQFAERVRGEVARCKLEKTALPIEAIAKACGFGNAERMRRTFQRLFETSPADYRARFRSTLLTQICAKRFSRPRSERLDFRISCISEGTPCEFSF